MLNQLKHNHIWLLSTVFNSGPISRAAGGTDDVFSEHDCGGVFISKSNIMIEKGETLSRKDVE